MKPTELIECLRIAANEGPLNERILDLQSAPGLKFRRMTEVTRQDLRDLCLYLDDLHETDRTIRTPEYAG